MSQAARVPVLMYHRVGSASNSWEARFSVSAARFERHMRALRKAGYQAIEIDRMIDWLEGKASLPPGAFLLTFDDGYQGVFQHALPVLESMQWPATVFLVSNLIGGDDEWTSTANPSGQTYPLLSKDEIWGMQGRGINFQSHTCDHLRLPTLSDQVLADQMRCSREELASMLGSSVDYLAYPYGLVDERVEEMARSVGYRAAFSTQPGFNRPEVNRFRIRRLEICGTDSTAVLLRKMKFGTNDGGLANAARYYASRLASRLSG